MFITENLENILSPQAAVISAFVEVGKYVL